MFNIRVLREHNFVGNSCMVRIRKKVCRVSLITNQSLVMKNRRFSKLYSNQSSLEILQQIILGEIYKFY